MLLTAISIIVASIAACLSIACLVVMVGVSRAIRAPAVLDPASRDAERKAARDALSQGLLDDLREHGRPSGGRIHVHDVEVLLGRRRARGD